MDTVFITTPWEEAVQGFLLHLTASGRAPKTVRFHKVQLGGIAHWATAQSIPLDAFGKRHLDAYLASRVNQGVAQTTLHHDAVSAKAFFKWCTRNDLLDRSPLAEYAVRKAPKPYRYKPTEDDMQKLTRALRLFWEPISNPSARYLSANKRSFHRERNFAIVLLLADSGCRIGEALSLQVADVDLTTLTIHIRKSKGREPRDVPFLEETADALSSWLKVRKRVMAEVPAAGDEGWFFISETGTRIDEERFGKTFNKVKTFAGLPKDLKLHGIRHHSIHRIARKSVLAAKYIAGHKNLATTQLYTEDDPEFARQVHREAAVVKGVVESRRVIKKRRLVV